MYNYGGTFTINGMFTGFGRCYPDKSQDAGKKSYQTGKTVVQ